MVSFDTIYKLECFAEHTFWILGILSLDFTANWQNLF